MRNPISGRDKILLKLSALERAISLGVISPKNKIRIVVTIICTVTTDDSV